MKRMKKKKPGERIREAKQEEISVSESAGISPGNQPKIGRKRSLLSMMRRKRRGEKDEGSTT